MFINDEAQRQLLPVIARTTSVSPTADLQQRAGALLQLNPGQQVKAEIIANLPNSLYLARIAGQMYQLEIPLNVQPGETMEMTFLTAEPRITFQVLQNPQGSASVQLSSMGKWLAAVAQEGAPLEIVQQPLLDNPAQGTALLATRLKEAISQSGLFYESHLAQWAAGRMQLAEILKEPQGKLSAAGSKSEPDADAGATDDGIADLRTLPLVREQLNLLHSGVLNWKGEPWPGQGMELQVTEGGADDGEPAIEASLALDLPHLGGVDARIRFGAEGLSVEFVCDRHGSAALLKEGGDGLRQALSSSGLHLARMAAKDDEDKG
jgi:flagellar hook-length control protein FliK